MQEVVFLHGFLESPLIWKPLVNTLEEKGIRCTNKHLDNHQPEKEEPYIDTLDLQAERLHQSLTKDKVKNPILIGHSLGGYIALALIEKYPSFASGLVLVNSTCFTDSLERKEQRTRASNLVGRNKSAFVHMAIRNLILAEYQKTKEAYVLKLIANANELPAPAIQASLKAMRDRKDQTQVLKNFEAKKLYIFGKKDPLISYESNIKAIRESNTPSLELDSGHMSWLEDEENLHQGIIQFLGLLQPCKTH